MPPETAFLCRALAVDGAPPPAPPGLDWPALAARAAHDRLEIALDAVADRIEGMPAAFRIELRDRARARILRSMALAAESARITRAFEQQGAKVLLLKGCALSQQLHGAPFRRHSLDVDLMVPPGRRDEAAAILRSLGYRPHRECRPHDREQDEQIFLHAQGGLAVDLHERLASHDALLPLAFVRPWQRAERLDLGGTKVATLPVDMAVLHAAQHGTKHLWRRLGWLYDLAAASRAGRIPWSESLAAAAALGAERSLLLTARLAEELFASPLPPVLSTHPALPEAEDSLRALIPVLTAPPAGSDIESVRVMGRARYLLWENRLHRGWRRKAAALAVHARPTVSDTEILSLPRGLRGLYLPIRLARVLLTALRR